MSKHELVLYWKMPEGFDLQVFPNNEVWVRWNENGTLQQVTFAPDVTMKTIEGVLKFLGGRKKRSVVL